ncbi:RelA/SpoT domain-containing protein [Aureivirga marina]|uniref:RelA/SpoT domain-containing protein n=1 Tax=Aureivirga marina TaxID=1182451 RepID=UPI0018CAE1A1|nr:RelA/SpoT domain-containing protein [Aureivirga marina]
MTKSQVNKLGKALRKKIQAGETPEIELLEKLQEYRTSYKEDLSAVFEKISNVAKNARKDSITSFRIKRIESILSKIKRQPTMSLGNMGDIAGCRILLYSKDSLIKVIKNLKLNFEVVGENDYLAENKEDGYKGYHIYIKSPINQHKIIEIQVRTVKSHKWASMVEIIDILYNLKIKEGQQHPDFEKFHLLLANNENLSLDEQKELIRIDDKYNIHSKLNEVFIKNHVKIRKDWFDISPNKNPFFIIEVDKNKSSNISSFESYEIAENEYFEKFKVSTNSNFVLTHIEKPNFKRLCIAYASYVLIKHDYLNDWNRYTSDILDDLIKNNEFEQIKYFKNYTQKNLKEQLRLLETELSEISKYQAENITNFEGFDEWIKEIQERVLYVAKITIERTIDKKKKNLWNKIFG